METKTAVAALTGLAQETRLEVFRLLVRAGGEGLPAGRIGERLGLPSPTLSFHLSQLKQAGLVHSRRDGRSLIYSADFVGMQALMTYLTENCCAEGSGVCDTPLLSPHERASKTS